ncbi:MAG TPA: hypothetical protein VJU77_01660 [Chthoniobacterales bacterium]|nr:hypothetical protein [Chthoniobacterales bacterium]
MKMPLTPHLPCDTGYEADEKASENNVEAETWLAEQPAHHERNDERQANAAQDSPRQKIIANRLDDHCKELSNHTLRAGLPVNENETDSSDSKTTLSKCSGDRSFTDSRILSDLARTSPVS